MIFLFGFDGRRTCSVLAWDQALHWGKKEKKSRRGRKKKSRRAKRAERKSRILDLGREKGGGAWKHALDAFSSSLRSHLGCQREL